MLSQYFPKGQTDFRGVLDSELDRVAYERNTRPRATLDYATPAGVYAGTVAMTT